jgi:uncharacterized membrane protein
MNQPGNHVFTPHRLEAFSDGVLAIVITLLVLEIKVPPLPHGAGVAEAASALAALAPKFAAFLLSFLFIAVFWVNHHRFFALVKTVDGGLLWLNNFLLLFLCFVPFPTAFAGDHPWNAAPLALFAAVLLMAGLTFNAMWRYARSRGLFAGTVDAALVGRAARRGLVGPAAYALAGLAAPLAPALSWLGFFLIPAYYALPGLRRVGPQPREKENEA